MNSRWISLPVLCAVAAAVMAAPVLAQDKPDAKGGAPQMNEEMMAWMKAATPNENHERLSYMIGKWKTTVKIWEPGKPEASVSTGTNVNEWLLGKRYVGTHYNGEFMGMPFEGMGITGYDNISGRYFSGWVDSMSTFMMTEYGQYHSASKTFTYTGRFTDPLGSNVKSKSVFKIVNDDKHVLTMYHTKPGQDEIRAMEITYVRDGGGRAALTPTIRLVEAGCGECTYKMDGVTSCALAVKIDGKPYLVSGTDVSAHEAGLCRATKQAEIAGEVKYGKFVATSFKLRP